MLNERDGKTAYIIDEEYRIVDYERELERYFSNIREGEYCYRCFGQGTEPCQGCPVGGAEDSHGVVYCKPLDEWMKVTALPMSLRKDCKYTVLYVQELDEKKESFLYEIANSSAVSQAFRVDLLTGLHKRKRFLSQVKKFLEREAQNQQKWCIVSVDIEHFKLFNEWYGQTTGDLLLKNIGMYFKRMEEKQLCIAGYFGADDFLVLMPNQKEYIEQMYRTISGYLKVDGNNSGFLPVFGVFAIDDPTESVSTMCNKAQVAAATLKGNYGQRICWFDRGMIEQMERKQKLLSGVRKGIEKREFTFFVQPKCDIRTGKIVSLEALVRWNHPRWGTVSPGEYIPLLERSGLITGLDIYVWEEVCRALSEWQRAGRRLVPISVNVSIVDIRTMDVPGYLQKLTERYQIPPGVLAVEITETAFAENGQIVRDVIDRLHRAGFTIMMDDFGSGYSSLNMLKDINVDVLKIDMKFIDLNEQNLKRGISILESIIRLANMMDLRVIAEGVEEKRQVDFLLSMGCVYGQGYYFYRPMPREELEEIIRDESVIDFRGICPRKVGYLYAKDFLREDIVGETVLNNILGPSAYYRICKGHIKLLRSNEQYNKLLGISPAVLEDDHFNILKYVSEDDRPIFDSMIQEAYNNQLSGSQGIMQYKKSDRTEIWLSLQIYFVRQEEDGQIYFVSARDDTERMLKVLSKQPAHRMLSAVLQMSNSNHSFKNLTEKNRRLAALVFGKLAPGGLIGGYCESGFPLYFANDAMVKLLGYKDYDDFCRGIGGMVENTIYPDDRRMVKKDVGDIYCPGEEYVTTYRMLRKDGTWFWVIDKGLVTEAEDGRPALISACTDISQIIEQQGKLIKNNSELLLQNEEMKYFYDMLPGAYHRCADTPDFDFLYISERFPEMFGYTRAQIAELFGNKLIHMIHPKDRKKVRRATQDIRERGLEKGLEYRVRGAQGYVWVLDETKYVEKDGGGFFVGVLLNITESKERERVSRLDLLTGVLNRNAAIPLIEEYLEKLPAGQTAAFLMMDMDNLKEINDKLGHDYGDAALVHCVNQIRQAIGRDAIIGRMGGDEFVMLCKNTSMPLLEHKLWVFRHEFSDVFTLRGHHANAEISLGYAFAPKDGYEFEELYHKADAALRRAKKSGKRTFKRYMESME